MMIDEHRRRSFVRTCRVSKLCPHQPVNTLGYPKSLKRLGLEPRTFATDFMDRNAEFAKAGNAIAYYVCRFRCQVAMRVAVFLGYDGPVKMWVDGRETFCDPHGTNPAVPDAGQAVLEMAAGDHEVLVALDIHQGCAWGIFLRLAAVDADGQPTASKHWPETLEARDSEVGVSSMAARNVTERPKRA